MIPPLVLLMMAMCFARDLVFCLHTQRDILSGAPVNGGALARSQLPLSVDEEALGKRGNELIGMKLEAVAGCTVRLRHASHITHHASRITHHTSHLTHHTPHTTHHTSHTTHHTSHVTPEQGPRW
jgi:hypothetical protein